MKLVSKLSIVAAAMLRAACAPRDTTHYYSIQDALNSSEAKEIIDPSVKLYFGKPAPGKVIKAGLVSKKKTNAANKSDEKSCTVICNLAVKISNISPVEILSVL